jgi:hypothetical protein
VCDEFLPSGVGSELLSTKNVSPVFENNYPYLRGAQIASESWCGMQKAKLTTSQNGCIQIEHQQTLEETSNVPLSIRLLKTAQIYLKSI